MRLSGVICPQSIGAGGDAMAAKAGKSLPSRISGDRRGGEGVGEKIALPYWRAIFDNQDNSSQPS
jgi:hypothetical protein